MNSRTVRFAVLFAGAVLTLAPLTATADPIPTTPPPSSTTSPPVPSTTRPAPISSTPVSPDDYPGKIVLSLSPRAGTPGAKIAVTVRCAGSHIVESAALERVSAHRDGQVFKVKNVKPGTYKVNLACYSNDAPGDDGHRSVTFTVLSKAKQVAVKPKGAPETGGGFLSR